MRTIWNLRETWTILVRAFTLYVRPICSLGSSHDSAARCGAALPGSSSAPTSNFGSTPGQRPRQSSRPGGALTGSGDGAEDSLGMINGGGLLCDREESLPEQATRRLAVANAATTPRTAMPLMLGGRCATLRSCVNRQPFRSLAHRPDPVSGWFPAHPTIGTHPVRLSPTRRPATSGCHRGARAATWCAR